MMPIRVCIITSLRTWLGSIIDVSDFTYDLGRLAIVTDLEPLLAIIVACLPLFPPVMKRLFLRGKEPESRTPLSSSLARLRSKGNKNSMFRKFEDSYPLTDLEGTRTENHITRSDSKPESLRNDKATNIDVEMGPRSTIQVEQGWEVRSDKVR